MIARKQRLAVKLAMAAAGDALNTPDPLESELLDALDVLVEAYEQNRPGFRMRMMQRHRKRILKTGS